MGLFPIRFLRSNRRKRKSEPFEYSEEELDEQGMRDLEATLSQNSGLVILRGERLRKYEERMDKMTELFRRTAVLPVEVPVPLEKSQRANIQTLMMQSPTDTPDAGPSRSIDSADDFVHRTTSDHEVSTPSSRKFADDSTGSVLHSGEVVEAMQNESESARASQDMVMAAHEQEEVHAEQHPTTQVPVAVGLASDSAVFNKESHAKLQEAASAVSEGEEEVIGAAVLLDSNQGESVMPDTATTAETLSFAEMNDWSRFRHLTSFSDFNSPLPMKVSSFIDLQTQFVSSSHVEDSDRSPVPRTPEKDASETDGLVFAVDNFEMPLYLHSKSASSTTTSSSEADFEYGISLFLSLNGYLMPVWMDVFAEPVKLS